MSIEQIKERMAALNEELEAVREKAREQGKVLFEQACKSLFDSHPCLVAFKWDQYTPYFNDGDTCEFSVNDLYFKFTEAPDEDHAYTYDDEFYEFMHNAPESPQLLASKAVEEVHKLIDEDTYLDLFGDHVEVTVTRDGVETSECDHE